jgi:hypothetical protein
MATIATSATLSKRRSKTSKLKYAPIIATSLLGDRLGQAFEQFGVFRRQQ